MHETNWFAGPSRSVRLLHQRKVNIFRLSIPIPISTITFAPYLSATIVPGVSWLRIRANFH